MSEQIQLGNKIKDNVTGMVGIATARVVYLNGCVQYCLTPKTQPNALEISCFYIDEGQLSKVGEGIAAKEVVSPAPRRSGFGTAPKGMGLAAKK